MERLTKNEFHIYMERIMDNFCLLADKIDSITRRQNCLNGDTLLDTQDLCLLLKISKRTMHRYRMKGLLPYYLIEGKVYYKSSDLHAFIKKHYLQK